MFDGVRVRWSHAGQFEPCCLESAWFWNRVTRLAAMMSELDSPPRCGNDCNSAWSAWLRLGRMWL
jgi:hypothetical protein